MKLRLILLLCCTLPVWAQAQFSNIPLTPIQEIQGWTGQFLPDSCNDGPNPIYLNDTVRVRGVVMVNGGVTISSTNARWVWIRDITALPSTPYGHVTVRNATATSPFDIITAIAGDTIEVVGIVTEFNGTNAGNGETQLSPIANGVRLLSEEPGPAPQSYLLANLGELNGDLDLNGQPRNHLTTGEKYEGNFIEIQNLTVVQVQLTGAAPDDRCRILAKDANNNHIWIYDRFKTQRPSNGFVPPNVGDSYTSVKGLIESWKNGCPGTLTSNRGYNINPFSVEHYVKGASSPTVGNFTRVPVCPSATQPVSVSANITDDGSIASAEVLYSTNGTTWTTLSATATGTTYTATLPAIGNGTIVQYYFRAKDNLNNTTLQPNVPAGSAPFFYRVNDGGCTIFDMQYTPNTNGRSGYENQIVTLQGVVTSSAANTNLGYVYIQQPGQTSWAGIWVNGGTLIADLNVGDLVNVTGSINEYFGLTRISNVTAVQIVSTGQPVPAALELDPNIFTSYNFGTNEQYEGMLVKLKNPVSGQNLFVVDTNADAASSSNNGEYRVGSDLGDPNGGCRVLAGRQNSTAFSSLNVSYVNSVRWATEDGVMNVPVKLLTPGDQVNLLQGILTFSFSNMKLLPRNNSDVDILVGVKPLLSENQYKLYPNPANQRFNLSFDVAIENGTVEVVNQLGQHVQSATVNGQEVEMSSRNMASGLYMIRVKNQAGKLLAAQMLAIQK